MVIQEPLTAQVIRVNRHDTLLVRTHVPQLQAAANIHLVLEGVRCKKSCKPAIIDWVEIHNDWGRLRLVTLDWLRDTYGRILGDLADPQSGETITSYLLQHKMATPWPNHQMEVIREMMQAEEPDDAGW